MNRVFARLQNINDRDEVFAIIQEVNNIDEEWHPDYVKRLVDITDMDTRPEPGWIYEDGIFSLPVIVLSPDEQMIVALRDGCEVHSTSKPELNGTYIVNGQVWQQMRDQVLYIVSFGDFSGGLTQLEWPTKDDEVVFTSTDDFKTVVRALGDWLTGWQAFVMGKSPQHPPHTITIA